VKKTQPFRQAQWSFRRTVVSSLYLLSFGSAAGNKANAEVAATRAPIKPDEGSDHHAESTCHKELKPDTSAPPVAGVFAGWPLVFAITPHSPTRVLYAMVRITQRAVSPSSVESARCMEVHSAIWLVPKTVFSTLS
jgi:hypothetical protein